MTAKVKAAAYRLTGGSKTVYSAEYESKVALFHTFRNQTEKLISQLTKLVTDNMATEVMQKLSKDNAEMGMNKFERVGEALHKYGTQLDDDHSAEVLEKAKDVFEKMGQEHRSLRTNIIEKVQKPLKEWIDTDAKDTGKELKTLESRRDELDCAINKLRKKQDDADCQGKKNEAEEAHKEQFEKVDELLDEEIKKCQSVLCTAMIQLMEVQGKYNKKMMKILKVRTHTSVYKQLYLLSCKYTSKCAKGGQVVSTDIPS